MSWSYRRVSCVPCLKTEPDHFRLLETKTSYLLLPIGLTSLPSLADLLPLAPQGQPAGAKVAEP